MRLDTLAFPPDGTPATVDDVLAVSRRGAVCPQSVRVGRISARRRRLCGLSPRSVVRSTDFRWPSSWWRASWSSIRRKSWSRCWTSISAFTTIAPMRRRRGMRRCWPRSTGVSASLSPNEATIFCLVSVFVGAFDLEDVVAIAAAQELSPFDVIAGLGGLVAKSLLTAQVNGAGLRYRLLDSTRRYATRRRHEAGLDAQARRSHAQRILALFEQSEAEWGWRDSDDWTQSYLGRAADVQAALAWAFGDLGDAALGVRLTVATIPLWFETSLISEAQGRVEVALEHAEALRCDDLLRTKLAMSRAWSMMYARTYVAEVEKAWLTAISFAQACGQPRLRAAGAGRSFHLSDAHRTHRRFDRAARGVPRDLCPTSGLVPGSGRRAHAGLGQGAHGRPDGKPGDARRAGGDLFAKSARDRGWPASRSTAISAFAATFP